jgi:hypothetical protein
VSDPNEFQCARCLGFYRYGEQHSCAPLKSERGPGETRVARLEKELSQLMARHNGLLTLAGSVVARWNEGLIEPASSGSLAELELFLLEEGAVLTRGRS